MDIFNIDPKQQPTDEPNITILFNALRAVNPAYGPITLQLELQGIIELSVIISHLEEAERRLAVMAVRPEAALQASDKKDKGKGKGKGKIECRYCGRKGHVKAKCYSWLRDTDEGRKYAAEHLESGKSPKTGPLPTPGAKGNLSPSPEKAQVAVTDEYIGEACWEAFEGTRSPGDWVIDSGATRHMTSNRKAFIEYAVLETERTAGTASGSVLLGIGLGKIRLSVKVNGRAKRIVLTDVLYVPQIKGA